MSNLWGIVQYYITKFSLGGIFYENIDHNLWFLPNGMFLTPIFIKITNILWGVPNKCGLQDFFIAIVPKIFNLVQPPSSSKLLWLGWSYISKQHLLAGIEQF